jgi:hypothetical protein
LASATGRPDRATSLPPALPVPKPRVGAEGGLQQMVGGGTVNTENW